MAMGFPKERMDMGGFEHKGEGQAEAGDSPLVVKLEFPAASGGEENDSLTPEDEGITGVLCGIGAGHIDYWRSMNFRGQVNAISSQS